MPDAALRLMTVAEFLVWLGVGDTRYQLRDGIPVAMAPPAPAHGILTAGLCGRLIAALAGKAPCVPQTEAGIASVTNVRSYHQADLAVSCIPHERGQKGIVDPILIIDVLSPTTADDDRRIKLPDYRLLPSVREIVLIDSEHLYCEVHRRLVPDERGDRWLVDLLREPAARLRLESVGLDVALEDVYANVALG